MCGHEVFEYVKTFTEVGLNRKLNGLTGCIRHKSTHTCKLLDLLVTTTGTGVGHHEYVVVLVKTVKKLFGKLAIGLVPGLYYRTISFFVGDKTSSVVTCNLFNGLLSAFKNFGLGSRHGHIGN